MAIGAISAYGAMSAVSFRPYVYNANTVNSASMNKLSRISDDVLDKKIDYSELADESLNENPLKKGQTLDFQGMLDMQMRRGQNIAAKIMRPMETGANAVQSVTEEAGRPAANAGSAAARFDLSGTEDAQPVEQATVEADIDVAADANGGNINYQMQQALRAYEMFMTA
ncbi:MAG: hypothetical protein K2P66_08360 [Lachnospiraceae bacterium]|nr:hypothetical protein [Lachnospiraceae bacterium]